MSAIVITQARDRGFYGYGTPGTPGTPGTTAPSSPRSAGGGYTDPDDDQSVGDGAIEVRRNSRSRPGHGHVNGHVNGDGVQGGVGAVGERTPLVRSKPLRDSISTARLVIICAGIWSSNFAFAVQSTAIPTLAPSVSSHFNHAELASYLGSVFTLGNTAGIPIYGVLMDSLGRKFAMIVACAFFAIGTIICAVAPGMEVLILGRAVAGLGGGGMLTVSAVICTDLVHLRDRGTYQGIMMTIFGLGSMIGGPASGWLADTYGWRWSFWVQVPVVLFSALIVLVFLPHPPIGPIHTSLLSGLLALDWAGTFLLVGSVTTLILGLSFHTSFLRPWSDPTVSGLLVASGVALVLFVGIEARVKRPIVPLSMFASLQLISIWASGFFLSVGSQALLFHIPMYFAVLVNSSAVQAGKVLSVCSGLGLSAGTLFAGYYIRKGGRYTLLGALSLVPTIGSALVAARWTPSWPWWSYYLTVLPSSFGYAVFLCVGLIALISSVDSHAMPKATALLYTSRSLGSTLGVSLGSSIQIGALANALRSRLTPLFPSDPAGAAQVDSIINAVLHSKAAIGTLEPDVKKEALAAYASSLSTVWIVAAGVAVLTFVSALGIKQGDEHVGEERGRGRERGKRNGTQGQVGADD